MGLRLGDVAVWIGVGPWPAGDDDLSVGCHGIAGQACFDEVDS